MSKDDTAPEASETCGSATPSRGGLLVAGAGVAGGAAAQLLSGDALGAGATATLDRLKRAERDPTHRILLGYAFLAYKPK